jgi:aldehyde:ferredoxin oxidoreductase
LEQIKFNHSKEMIGMFGFREQILRVNLSDKKVTKDTFEEADARKFLGGRGLAVKILFDELAAGIDPFGPDNKLVYATGPFAATGFPLNSRWIVAAKSPLTGIWGEAACGGTFAVQLRKAGYDALVVEGAASSPVYLDILDDEVRIRDASHLWGKMTLDTDVAIGRDLGIGTSREDNPSIICIGPAGEKLVKIANVIHTAHRAAGRTGLGAVMGSKKLKAIAVRGTKSIPVADAENLKRLTKLAVSECVTNKSLVYFSKYGQAGLVDVLNESGILPTKNFQKGTFESYEKISGKTMAETILKKKNACSQCPVACKRVVEVNQGPYAPVEAGYGGPEYENVAALGSLLMIGDLAAVSKENQMCNAYGVDTISTGVTIAWLMECYEKGIITKKDIDGIEATWGNAEAALNLIEKIALRDGIGNLLAEGIKKAAARIGRGSEKYAMEVKGLEIPMHEARGKKGLGLGYAVSSRGACHEQTFHDTDLEAANVAPEIGIAGGLNRHDTSRDKVDMIKKSQDWVAITNSLCLCTAPASIGFEYTKPSFLVEALNAITGMDFTVNELMTIGERMNNLCRCFNVREGITRKDDYLPRRFMEEPLPDGPSQGQRLTSEELQRMLEDYYELRGWNKSTGIPEKRKLLELGLERAAKAVEK